MLNYRRRGQRDPSSQGGTGSTGRERNSRREEKPECVGCSARAETTEAWGDEDAAEFYRARYEQTAEWISNLAFLMKAPAATANLIED